MYSVRGIDSGSSTLSGSGIDSGSGSGSGTISGNDSGIVYLPVPPQV